MSVSIRQHLASGPSLIAFACMVGSMSSCSSETSSQDTSGATSGVTSAAASSDSGPVATFEGVGRLRAGMRIPEALAALGGTIDTSGGSMPGSNCNYATFSALPPGTAIMIWADTIVRIEVDSARVRTRWGTGVGSTVAEIRQRHTAQDVRQEPHPYSAPTWHYMVVDPPGDTVHRIIFETDEQQRAQSYRVGFRRAVDLIEGCS
jgi:hypothetical protein